MIRCEVLVQSGSQCKHSATIKGMCIAHFTAASRRGDIVFVNGSTNFTELTGLVCNDVNR